LKHRFSRFDPFSMSETQKSSNTQPDTNLAAEERPKPSQAEGDRETIEEDLAQKEKADSTTPSGSQ
jgi:hypothetical protein